ncbi:MAG: alpha-E domain-containing protein [Sphingomonas sp.]
MLARTASNLYWIGRLMERAEFTTRLVEATIRLNALTDHGGGDQAWRSALSVVGAMQAFSDGGESLNPLNARRYLTLSDTYPGSIRSCISSARDSARAARAALSAEVWEAINRAWLLLRDRASPGGAQATLNLLENLKAEIRGFEGALARMLRSEGCWFVHLGAVMERGDNTARLIDVKYYILLPPGQEVGGVLDRDQWTTILQIVSARRAYRHIYREGLKPWLVADFLIFREELPRSLMASAGQAAHILGEFADRSGRQGPADRLARQRLARMEGLSIVNVVQAGLHEWLHRYIADNAAIDHAIAQQFRFG